MKNIIHSLLFCCLIFSFGCNDDDPNLYEQEQKLVIDLVDDAIAHYQADSANAFADFSNTNNSDWVFNEYYVFVNGFTAPNYIYAHIDSAIIGLSVLTIVDPDDGYEIGKSIVETAENNPDGGWVPEYRFTDPSTGLPRSKFSYVKVFDDYIFGSGYYVD